MVLLTYIALLGSFNIILGEDCLINHVPERMAWEKELRKQLECDTIILEPPTNNTSEPITVNIQFFLDYLIFKSNEEVFKVKTTMFTYWKDERLKWNPEKHFGITKTDISLSKLWTPSFRLYNSADSSDFDGFYYSQMRWQRTRCDVQNTGVVICIARVVHEALCRTNLTNWPYDVQECSLEFGALNSRLSKFRLNFTSTAINIDGTKSGDEWFLSGYRQEDQRSERRLKMTFVLVREAAGLAAIIVYPSVILTALTITCLFLDVRSNVRLGVACLCLAGHYYFLSELGSHIPKQSTFPPIILLYYRGSVVLNALMILFTFLLAAICKLKSTPHNYIISVNDLIFPRWDVDDIAVDSKIFSEDWIKFANVINNVLSFIIVITYLSLFCAFTPRPNSVNTSVFSNYK